MTRATLFCRSVFVVTLLAGPAGAQAFDRTAWRDDFDLLERTLESQYSNLAWMASPSSGIDVPALHKKTLMALSAATSDDEARTALLAFVQGFHDGHFSALGRVEPGPPINVPVPARPSFSRDDAATGCAALGYAPTAHTTFSMTFETLPGFRLLGDGVIQPIRYGTISSSGGVIGVLRIPEFELTSAPALCLDAWKKPIWDSTGAFIRHSFEATVEAGWYGAIAHALRDLEQRHAIAVVVDIGNNSGGDDSGDIAARLFTSAAIRSSSLFMVQNAAVSAAYYDEQLDALHKATQINHDAALAKTIARLDSTWTANKQRLADSTCTLHWAWTERRDWMQNDCRHLLEAGSAGGPEAYVDAHSTADARVAKLLHWPAQVDSLWGTWKGPLYVLTNEHTYSSAEMFAAVLQNNHAAKVIGSKTGGDGCGFMDAGKPLTLPHSQLRFRIPNCVRLRADGTNEVAGVSPDIPIPVADTRRLAQNAIDRILEDVSKPK